MGTTGKAGRSSRREEEPRRERQRILRLEKKMLEFREYCERFRLLLELAPHPLGLHVEGRWIYLNQAAIDLVGAESEEDLIGKPVVEVIHPESLSLVDERLNLLRQRKGKLPLKEEKLMRSDGTVVEVEATAVAFTHQGKEAVLVSFRDIAEKKKMERELKESRERLRTIIESEPECVKLLDSGGNLLHMNPAGLAMIEAESLEEVVGMCVYDLVVEKYRQAFVDGVERVFAGESSILQYEMVGLRGGRRWMESHSVPLRDAEDRVTALLAVTRDITEKKKAEERLQAEKERLDTILDSIADAVVTVDPGGRVDFLNRAAKEIFAGVEQVIAGVFSAFGPNDRKIMQEELALVLERGRRRHSGHVVEIKRAEGKEGEHSVSMAPLRNSRGEVGGAVLVFHDVSEKEKLDRERQRAARLESLGVLAGGIAHDFNNLLTGVLGNLSLLSSERVPAERHQEILRRAEKATLRAIDLTRQLLTFAQGGAPVKKVLQLAPLIRDAALFALSGSKAKCRFEIEEGLWMVEADEGQMSQVISNLVINADQAMAGGGGINISCRNEELSAGGLPYLPAGKYVKTTVTDEGCGISAENIDRVFDPYYSTKEKGTGLGLTTAYSIVKQHGGHIEVDSEPGQGTSVTFYLPAAEYVAEQVCPGPVEAGTGSGRVLFMDDEEVVREVGVEMLSSLGYEVVAASDGREAVEEYRQAWERGEPYDVVIMDLTVPGGMGGREALAEIREIDPDVRAVVSSGYSNDPIMADYESYGFMGVVRKPYRVAELGRVVAGLLVRP